MAYFTNPDGTRMKAGDTLKNPAYAATVRKVAAEGPKALLEGPVADAIVTRLHQGDLPSTMTLADLKATSPRSRPPPAARSASMWSAPRRPPQAAPPCWRPWASWNTPTSRPIPTTPRAGTCSPRPAG
uniref:Gamma-glutamyltransferase n=1 Tax=Phenylobacterium glaciei TaxID=2803784 RepID=A0A974S7M9_9CAUL|nr:gamma-glutamyltransferase [Phenylobacterium glaciei]